MLRHDLGNPVQRSRIYPVGLVQHDHVGALDLLLEQLLQRAFVIQRIIGFPRRLHRFRIAGEPARRIKSDPAFIAARERVMDLVFNNEVA